MVAMWKVEVRDRAVRSTPFVCPRCGLDREGTEVEPQRWCTVLSVPLIPLAVLDPVVRCDVCGHRSDVGVLDVPTTDVLAAWLVDAVRHAVATVVRAGMPQERSVAPKTADAAVAAIFAEGQDYDVDRLHDDLVGLDDLGTAMRLRRLVDELTPHGKQGLLHRLAAIGMSDGPLTARQRQKLVEIGCALGMSAPHINGVIATATLQPETA